VREREISSAGSGTCAVAVLLNTAPCLLVLSLCRCVVHVWPVMHASA
jgi:hypothetical protein